MPRHGPSLDPVQHARVANAADYSRVTTLWRRRFAGGEIRCELLRAPTPAKRIVQLVAEYVDGDSVCSTVRMCTSPADEALAQAYLERVIIEAGRRGPSGPLESEAAAASPPS